MEHMMEKSCRDFCEALASKTPIPGGGGVSALVGALGAALCSMAGSLTLGRKKYASHEAEIRWMLNKGEALRLRLLELAEEDAAAFEPLSRAYSIPRDDPNRDAVIQSAALHACCAPMEMMEQICRVVVLLEEMLDKGSAMLVSDVGCGALCCLAALESASLNIYVNTKTMTNRSAAQALNDRADELRAEFVPRAQSVAHEVFHRLHPEEGHTC